MMDVSVKPKLSMVYTVCFFYMCRSAFDINSVVSKAGGMIDLCSLLSQKQTQVKVMWITFVSNIHYVMVLFPTIQSMAVKLRSFVTRIPKKTRLGNQQIGFIVPCKTVHVDDWTTEYPANASAQVSLGATALDICPQFPFACMHHPLHTMDSSYYTSGMDN